MESKAKDKTRGLKENAKKRNQETFDKVDEAIGRLKRSTKKRINFKTVAEEAGVAIATLYNNPQIRERVEGLRAVQRDKASPPEGDLTPSKLKKDKLKQLYDEIKKFKKDKEKLILQLVEMEEIKAENLRLHNQLEKVILLSKSNNVLDD